ncbi:MAG TPA: hypothetical protein PLN69_06325 [bacterium]|nr:hypothetical protein [bacterium]
MSKNKKIAARSATSPVWAFILSVSGTLLFYQAIRDILISRSGITPILGIIIATLAAPLAAGILTYFWKSTFSIITGTAAFIAGSFMILSTTQFNYYYGEILIISGYLISLVGLLSYFNRLDLVPGYRNAGAVMTAAGIITAPAIHLFLRQVDKTHDFRLYLFIAAWAATSAMIGVSSFNKFKEEKPAPDPGPFVGFKTLWLFLSSIPFFFLFMVLGKPELLASKCAVSYRATILVIMAGLFLGCVDSFRWIGRDPAVKKSSRFALFIWTFISAIYLNFFFLIPDSPWNLPAVFIASMVIAKTLCWFFVFALSQGSPMLTAAAGFSFSLLGLGTFGLDAALLLENHIPNFYGMLMIPLVIFSFSTIGAKMPAAAGKNPFKTMSPGAVIISALPVILLFAFVRPAPLADAPRPEVEPLVFACLYTWYGTPDGTAGRTFNGPDGKSIMLDKEGGENDFSFDDMNMSNTMTENINGVFIVAGKSDGVSKNSFTIGFDFLSVFIHGAPVTSITTAYKTNRPDDELTLTITEGSTAYSTRLPSQTEMEKVSLEWPTDFKEHKATGNITNGNAHLSITVKGNDPETYSIAIDYVRMGRWRHFNEDFRKYFDEEKQVWFNDPPATIAAAHRVYYDGKEWPGIKPYGSPLGVYDSLDEDVMLSQLQLMEKAGIDVALFMHPWSHETITMGMNLIKENNIKLKVAWYTGVKNVDEFMNILDPIAADPVFLKVDGRPVIVLSPTGQRGDPHAQYKAIYEDLRDRGVLAIGDNYVTPKEEMLNITSGHYYYDTTGLYRARWGGKDIETSKPDGKFIKGYGHLFTLYDAISKITHNSGGIFLSTVIPGFHNLSVHDYEGTPLYDGRPGTEVIRYDGKTYAETWQTSIDSGADWICIVTWNELHEGTEIEPTVEDGVFYIKETKKWADKFRASRKK